MCLMHGFHTHLIIRSVGIILCRSFKTLLRPSSRPIKHTWFSSSAISLDCLGGKSPSSAVIASRDICLFFNWEKKHRNYLRVISLSRKKKKKMTQLLRMILRMLLRAASCWNVWELSVRINTQNTTFIWRLAKIIKLANKRSGTPVIFSSLPVTSTSLLSMSRCVLPCAQWMKAVSAELPLSKQSLDYLD